MSCCPSVPEGAPAEDPYLRSSHLAFGTSDTGSGTITTYALPWDGGDSPIVETFLVVRVAGVVDLMAVVASTGPVGGSVVFTTRLNGVDGALLATLAAGATSASGAAASVAVVPGDRLSLKQVKGTAGAGALDAKVTYRFTPTT